MLEPLFGRVLIDRQTVTTATKTKLIIPELADKRNAPAKGRVIAKGPTADASIPIGAMVLHGQHAGAWIKEGEREFYIVQDEDILAVVSDD